MTTWGNGLFVILRPVREPGQQLWVQLLKPLRRAFQQIVAGCERIRDLWGLSTVAYTAGIDDGDPFQIHGHDLVRSAIVPSASTTAWPRRALGVPVRGVVITVAGRGCEVQMKRSTKRKIAGSRKAQGFGPYIEDPVVLARIARLISRAT